MKDDLQIASVIYATTLLICLLLKRPYVLPFYRSRENLMFHRSGIVKFIALNAFTLVFSLVAGIGFTRDIEFTKQYAELNLGISFLFGVVLLLYKPIITKNK